MSALRIATRDGIRFVMEAPAPAEGHYWRNGVLPSGTMVAAPSEAALRRQWQVTHRESAREAQAKYREARRDV